VRGHRWPRILIGAAGLGLGLLAWDLYARAQENQLFVPTVSATAAALWGQLGSGEFWAAYGETLVPFVYGWLLALVVGIAAGLAIGRLQLVDGLTKPYVAFLNALPVSTLIPIIVIVFGIGLAARTAVVFLFAVIEVVLTTAAGARKIDAGVMEMARSFRAPAWRRFRRVILPGSLPAIVTGVRVGTARAVVGMVVMELLLVSLGVGLLLSRYKDTFRSDDLYALVVSLAVFGLLLQWALRWLERKVLSWRPLAWEPP
jgi:ABC-type nitrate/sulfonate/bicarbonate transport system permease component